MFSRRLAQNALQAARPTRSSFIRPLAPLRGTIRVSSVSLRLLSTEVRAAIDKAVGSAPVVLFLKGTPEMPQCGFSRAAVQILGLQGVDPNKFVAFNVLEDNELRQGIKEYSDWPTIPQCFLGGELIGGTDILMSMHQDGSLAKLLQEKGVILTEDAAEGETSSSEPSKS